MLHLRKLAHMGARPAQCAFACLAGAIALLSNVVTPIQAQETQAKELQLRATARIASFHEHLKKTGKKAPRNEELKQAGRELDEAYRAFLAAGDLGAAAACRVEAANALRHQARFEDALKLYLEGESLARKANVAVYVARALIGQSITNLNDAIKDNKSARLTADEAIRVSLPLPEKKELFEARLCRGEVDLAQGKLFAALDQFNQALALGPKVKDATLLFFAYHDRAATHSEIANQQLAQPRYAVQQTMLGIADTQKALQIANKQGWTALAQQAQILLTNRRRQRTLVEMKLPKLDLSVFNPSNPGDVFVSQNFISDEKTNLPPELIEMVKSWKPDGVSQASRVAALGHLASISGRNDEALARYLEAVELIEDDYRAFTDIQARLKQLLSNLHFYHWPMAALLQEKKVAEAFRLMELSRARTLADLFMTRAKIELANPQERDLYERLHELRALLIDRSALYARLSDTEPAGPAIRKIDTELGELRGRYRGILKEIRTNFPGLLQLVTAEPAPLSAVEQTATTGAFDLLEYVVMNDQLIVWHIGKSGTHVVSVFLPHELLKQKIDSLRGSLTDPKVAFDTKTSRQLFMFLVQPIRQHVTTNHLVIIPHEELCYVPFEVLQDWPDRRYLGEQFRITYAPSASILPRLKASGKLAGSAVLAVAGPRVAEADAEVIAIARLYPGSRVVSKDNATAAYVKRTASSFGVLHIAAHAAFDGNEPMDSFIELTPFGSNDGKLTAREMFAMELGKARLVTLSACETGRSGGTGATEMLGMPRALIHAGAPAVLLTQWPVDSHATREWMLAFYQEAVESPLPEAARRATLSLRRRAEFEHPYYWGAFYLVGR